MAKQKTIKKIELGVALFNLSELGVKSIRIEYSGGGDSGSVEDINPLDKKGEDMNSDKLPKWDEIKEALEHWAYKRLENTPGDWVNNEGGAGTFYIQIPSGEYTLEHRLNITEDYDFKGTVSKELED